MACTCIDFSGAPLSSCNGLCKNVSNFKEQNKTQIDSYDSNKTEFIFSQFLDKLDQRIKHFERLIKEGHLQGFKEGFGFARDIYDDSY